MHVHYRQETRLLRIAVSQPTDWATVFHVKETRPLDGERVEYRCSLLDHDMQLATAEEQYCLLF